MSIEELYSLKDNEVEAVISLMRELNSAIPVTPQMIRSAVGADGTHFFAIRNEEGNIIGCASICVFNSPTGKKAQVEDVVVSSSFRSKHLGKQLMEHVIEYARTELKDVDLYLTSRPQRVAANGLYKTLGFRQKETNVYKMEEGR